MKHAMTATLLGLAVVWAAPQAEAQEVKIEQVMSGLDAPWGMAFLPGGGFLVTERGGTLTKVTQGNPQQLAGVPEVYDSGQGGLLDVMIPRDFAESREVLPSHG